MFRIKEILAVLLCAGLFCACGEKNYNSGVENITPRSVYTTTPVETQISVDELLDDEILEESYDFIVKYGLTAEKSGTLEATVGADFSLVDAYNKSKSKEYKALPEAYLSFPAAPVNVPAGIDGTAVTFKLINLEELPDGNYLLPVTIKSAKAGSGYTVHEVKNTAYYVIIKGIKVVKKLTNLKVVDYSDEEVTDGGGVHTVLDGDPGTFWHSGYEDPPKGNGMAQLPHWLILDLSRTMTVTQIDIQRRSNGDTKSFEWYIHESTSATAPASSDAGWKQITSGGWASNSEEPHKQTKSLAQPQKSRYLKLILPDSHRAPFTGIISIDVFGYR